MGGQRPPSIKRKTPQATEAADIMDARKTFLEAPSSPVTSLNSDLDIFDPLLTGRVVVDAPSSCQGYHPDCNQANETNLLKEWNLDFNKMKISSHPVSHNTGNINSTNQNPVIDPSSNQNKSIISESSIPTNLLDMPVSESALFTANSLVDNNSVISNKSPLPTRPPPPKPCRTKLAVSRIAPLVPPPPVCSAKPASLSATSAISRPVAPGRPPPPALSPSTDNPASDFGSELEFSKIDASRSFSSAAPVSRYDNSAVSNTNSLTLSMTSQPLMTAQHFPSISPVSQAYPVASQSRTAATVQTFNQPLQRNPLPASLTPLPNNLAYVPQPYQSPSSYHPVQSRPHITPPVTSQHTNPAVTSRTQFHVPLNNNGDVTKDPFSLLELQSSNKSDLHTSNSSNLAFPTDSSFLQTPNMKPATSPLSHQRQSSPLSWEQFNS